MKTYRVGSLRFTLPQSWHEVTFAQERAMFGTTDQLTVLTTLSGKSRADFRMLGAVDVADIINNHLQFITTPCDFRAYPLPESITIGSLSAKKRLQNLFSGRTTLAVGEKVISFPRHIGSQTSYGQKLDLDEELKLLTIPEGDDDAALRVVAPLLLSVYLAPLILNVPYSDIEQAKRVAPLIDALPCTTALPLAAFFLSSWWHPTHSGITSSAA